MQSFKFEKNIYVQHLPRQPLKSIIKKKIESENLATGHQQSKEIPHKACK